MEFTLRGLINGPRVGYLQHEDKTKRTETYGASFTPPSAGIPDTGYTQKDVSSSPFAVCFSSSMNVIEYYPCRKLFVYHYTENSLEEQIVWLSYHSLSDYKYIQIPLPHKTIHVICPFPFLKGDTLLYAICFHKSCLLQCGFL